MKDFLDKKDMTTYFQGTVSVQYEEKYNGVSLERFNSRQLAHLNSFGESRVLRAHSASGIILSLRTDSPFIEIHFTVIDSCRPWITLDIEVDQQLVASPRWEPITNHTYQFHFDLSAIFPKEKEKILHDIFIYFPHTAWIVLNHIYLSDEAVITKPNPLKNHILCLGDSITQGMDAIHPSQIYPVILAKLLHAELLNQGIGGHLFDPDILSPPPNFNPDLITIAYGTNDWNQKRDLHTVVKMARTCLQKLHDIFPGIPLFLILPTWRSNHLQPPEGQIDLLSYNQYLAKNIQDLDNVYLINGFTLVPHLKEYVPDGLHPNDLGFFHYAVHLARRIFPLLPPCWFKPSATNNDPDCIEKKGPIINN